VTPFTNKRVIKYRVVANDNYEKAAGGKLIC